MKRKPLRTFILCCGAVCVVLLLLFPPWQEVIRTRSGKFRAVEDRGRNLVFAPPDGETRVRGGVLASQVIAAVALAGLCFWLCRGDFRPVKEVRRQRQTGRERVRQISVAAAVWFAVGCIGSLVSGQSLFRYGAVGFIAMVAGCFFYGLLSCWVIDLARWTWNLLRRVKVIWEKPATPGTRIDLAASFARCIAVLLIAFFVGLIIEAIRAEIFPQRRRQEVAAVSREKAVASSPAVPPPPSPTLVISASANAGTIRDARPWLGYRVVSLPLGVSIEVPEKWRLLGAGENDLIENSAIELGRLASIELPAKGKREVFRANSMPRTTYAGVAVSIRDSDTTAEEVARMSEAQIEALGPEFEKQLDRIFEPANMRIARFHGVRRTFISQTPAIVIDYTRSGPGGFVLEQMTLIYRAGKCISLSLAYRQSEGLQWETVIGHMQDSFRIDE